MSVLPATKLEQIQFCETHNPIWAAQGAAIGLTSAQVAGLVTLTTAARASYSAAQAARQASKGATTTFHNNTQSMRNVAADLIAVIKAYAESKNDPNIYAIAQIPPPAPPTPATPPTQPTAFAVILEPSGALTLSWESENSAASTGGFFTVQRRLGAGGFYQTIGGTPGVGGGGRRNTFTDDTLPSGTPTLSYIVTPKRGTLTGTPSEAVNITFGVGGGLSVTGGSLAIAA
jgi:hypothetical protein